MSTNPMLLLPVLSSGSEDTHHNLQIHMDPDCPSFIFECPDAKSDSENPVMSIEYLEGGGWLVHFLPSYESGITMTVIINANSVRLGQPKKVK